MGGKKKLSLKQMEKMQAREEERKKKEKEKEKGAEKEKKPAGIFADVGDEKKLIEELRKMRVLTPYVVASRFNIRISAAKDLLEQLEHKGLVQFVSGNHDLKIYRAA